MRVAVLAADRADELLLLLLCNQLLLLRRQLAHHDIERSDLG